MFVARRGGREDWGRVGSRPSGARDHMARRAQGPRYPLAPAARRRLTGHERGGRRYQGDGREQHEDARRSRSGGIADACGPCRGVSGRVSVTLAARARAADGPVRLLGPGALEVEARLAGKPLEVGVRPRGALAHTP